MQTIDPSILISSLRKHEGEVGDLAKSELARFEQFALSSSFYVAVVGEFKRGKSTLLNALLGQNILPTDVTPTTATVNIIRYSDEPILIVHYADGSSESRTLTRAALFEFTAEANFNPDSLEYVEVGLPSPILVNGLVLVDTPGVNDLNAHRSEVVYKFLPRSDALIFLLSATQPVTQSEIDFLKFSVLKEGLSRIAYVANFADQLDEDTPESVISQVRNRITSEVGIHDCPVFLTSASLAVEGFETEGQENLKQSGVEEVANFVLSLASSEERAATKNARVLHRAATTAKGFAIDIEQRISLAEQTVESLAQELLVIEDALGRKQERLGILDDWLADRQAEILAMTRKSLRKFQDETQDVILESFHSFPGGDFKVFVEKSIPGRVRQYCKLWTESYAPPLATLLAQIDAHIVNSLGVEFEEVVSRMRPSKEIRFEYDENQLLLEAEDSSKSQLRTGLLAGGAATLAIIMGAGMVLPLIAMAAYPYISKRMNEHDLANAKVALKPKLTEALDATLSTYSASIVTAVTENIRELRNSAVERYYQLLAELKDRVEIEVSLRQSTQSTVTENSNALRARLSNIQELVEQWTARGHTAEE